MELIEAIKSRKSIGGTNQRWCRYLSEINAQIAALNLRKMKMLSENDSTIEF